MTTPKDYNKYKRISSTNELTYQVCFLMLGLRIFEINGKREPLIETSLLILVSLYASWRDVYQYEQKP